MDVDFHSIEDFKIHLPHTLSKIDRDKIQLILMSYGINWRTSHNQLLDLQDIVYVNDRNLYHSNDIYPLWEHFLKIDYKDVLYGY